MVSRMGVQGGDKCQTEPKPRSSNVAASDQRSKSDRKKVGEDMLHRMGVQGSQADGGGPFMMLLVDVLVNLFVVEQPMGVVEHHLLH